MKQESSAVLSFAVCAIMTCLAGGARAGDARAQISGYDLSGPVSCEALPSGQSCPQPSADSRTVIDDCRALHQDVSYCSDCRAICSETIGGQFLACTAPADQRAATGIAAVSLSRRLVISGTLMRYIVDATVQLAAGTTVVYPGLGYHDKIGDPQHSLDGYTSARFAPDGSQPLDPNSSFQIVFSDGLPDVGATNGDVTMYSGGVEFQDGQLPCIETQ